MEGRSQSVNIFGWRSAPGAALPENAALLSSSEKYSSKLIQFFCSTPKSCFKGRTGRCTTAVLPQKSSRREAGMFVDFALHPKVPVRPCSKDESKWKWLKQYHLNEQCYQIIKGNWPMYLASPIEWSSVGRSFAVVKLGLGSDDTESIKLLVNPNSAGPDPLPFRAGGSSHGLRPREPLPPDSDLSVVVESGVSQKSPFSDVEGWRVDLLKP